MRNTIEGFESNTNKIWYAIVAVVVVVAAAVVVAIVVLAFVAAVVVTAVAVSSRGTVHTCPHTSDYHNLF